MKRPSSGQQLLHLQQLECTLRDCMLRWSQRLTALQPKCVVGERLIEHGIAIFDAFSLFYMEQMNNSHNGGEAPPQLSWEALGAACFWVSIKADGSRACLPSRALLERACSIPAVMLSSLETIVLTTLQWDIFGLLRRRGFGVTCLSPGESEPRGFH